MIALQQVGVKDYKHFNATENTRMKQGVCMGSQLYILTWRSIANDFMRYGDSVVVRTSKCCYYLNLCACNHIVVKKLLVSII